MLENILIKRRGVMTAGAIALLAAVVLAAIWLVASIRRDVPGDSGDALEHFKYGSIGTEAELGIPRPIFEILPVLFEDLLPPGPGAGYERFGLIYEPGHTLPVGLSERQGLIPLVGLNCASCHAGTLRASPGAPPRLLPGAPSTRFNSGDFLRFLLEAGSDPRFEPDRLFRVMEDRHQPLSWSERIVYRLVVVPELRARLLRMRAQFSWLQRRPAFGPGRADTVNAHKALLGVDMAGDETVGTADYAPLYDQKLHRGLTLHWEESEDQALRRIAAWMQDLQPPLFPRERIDLSCAERGRVVWERECADCHAIGGRLVGRVTSAVELRTDPERIASFTEGLLGRLRSRWWRPARSFPEVDGYVNVPLDGLWVRAPYLHNGSVPTLRDLLRRPEERPEVFFRGDDEYDWDRVGYVSTGPAAEKVGFRYDTRLRGNHNTGHLYGTDLSEDEKEALLEYLKTL